MSSSTSYSFYTAQCLPRAPHLSLKDMTFLILHSSRSYLVTKENDVELYLKMCILRDENNLISVKIPKIDRKYQK